VKKTTEKILAVSVALLTATSLLLSGCASCFQGTREEIMVSSDAPNARVSLNDGMSGPAPYTAKVPRDEDLTINVSAPGYQSTTISDVSHPSWGYVVADFFLTGLIGLGIDGIDGAMFGHDQTMVAAHLEPTAPAGASASAAPVAQPVIKDVR
jgi:hypothetical protein